MRLLRFIPCLLFVVAQSVTGQELKPGILETLAGTGKAGFTGDGGAANIATLNQPFHTEVDNKGHLYIAEAFNHCIRKIDLKTGKISTVAGNGKKGYSGDGGPATQATFNEPYAVVVDADNHLYIADRLNAVVRKVDGKTGLVSTIAGSSSKGFAGDGGPGNQAQLREPNDVCLDGKGGLLIADVADWRIRRLDLSTGVIQTFAGVGRAKPKAKGLPSRAELGDGSAADSAIVVGARAVCVDGKGNTFICEREGSSIRKVDAKGMITTFSGDGKRGYQGDGGDRLKAVYDGPKAIRADRHGHLYIVDTENHCVRKIDASTGIVTTIAGGKKGTGGDGGPAINAGMDRPHGCVVDSDGILYIADSNNHRVRVVRLGQ